MDHLTTIAVNVLYLLALINPISKVSILSALPQGELKEPFARLAAKSTLAAAGILIGAMIVGDFILRSVFRVDLYSLRLAGGVVVFLMGLNALRHGRFFEREPDTKIDSLALVPLACPMIAGPATIAACIGLRTQDEALHAMAAILLALGANHVIMLFSQAIGRALTRFNLLGAIIRITGLIVMTIGTQMALDGIAGWMAVRGN